MATARSARMPLAPSMERLAAALARLPGVAAASASPAARSSAAATRATAADLTGRHDRAPGVEDAPPARTARSEASLPWAGAPAPGRAARDPWPEAPPRSAPPRSAPPGATRAEPDEPALAESPMTGLRRFAMMAEADAPPAPAQVETTAALGPRGPSVPTHALPLDDVELSERITRVIRREARRDGIDLEPSS